MGKLDTGKAQNYKNGSVFIIFLASPADSSCPTNAWRTPKNICGGGYIEAAVIRIRNTFVLVK